MTVKPTTNQVQGQPPVPELLSTKGIHSPVVTTQHNYSRPEGNYGLFLQIVRSLLILTWFNCCCVSIGATQLIGLPLYFINQQWFHAYRAMTKRLFGIAITALTEWCSPTPVRISGDSSVQGQFSILQDGRVSTKFPDRLVLIANHQVYTDWLYLWWVTYTNGMHGHIYIILKESLKYIPIIGPGMIFYGFIFMARKWVEDRPRLLRRLRKLKNLIDVSPCGVPTYDPMWLLIFPEGTNLTQNTKKKSDAFGTKQGIATPKHVLLPRSTGLFFCLKELEGNCVDYVYDCTIGYEGPPPESYADAYFTIRSTYLRGRPPKVVNFYWRRFAVKDIPLDDQKAFESWLFKRWEEKDELLDEFIKSGQFPPFGEAYLSNGKAAERNNHAVTTSNRGYIESEIKLGHWGEVGKIYATLALFGLFLYLFPFLWSQLLQAL